MARHLSDEQLAKFKEAFSLFDKDGNGAITTKELGTVMRSLGHNPTKAEQQDTISEINANGSSSVDFPEFLSLMAKRTRELEDKGKIYDAFQETDKFVDSYIGVFRLRLIMTDLEWLLTDEEVDEIVIDLDLEGDGSMNYKLSMGVMKEK